MKFCECGCGQTTPIAKRTDRKHGRTKGQPTRCCPGHRLNRSIPLEQRFWEKVAKRGPDECWLWTATFDHHGYGHIRVDGKSLKAHRVAYELTYGPIPYEDLEGNRVCVLHRCDTPACINPVRLRLGTAAENMAEMDARGRRVNVSHRGEANGSAKLTAADARVIREWGPAGWTQLDLAAVFGVSRSAIQRVVRGETWAHA